MGQMVTLRACVFSLLCLATMLVSVAFVHGAPGTTPNFQEIFLGRCYEYVALREGEPLQGVGSNCSTLYRLFEEAFVDKPSCGLDDHSYRPFVQAARQELPADKSLFWSATYAMVDRLAQNGQRFLSLEDTMIGYLADRLTWCGNATNGMDYRNCPGWGNCEGESSAVFWNAASIWFAQSAKGEVHVLLNGSNPDTTAYRRDSFFGRVELPYLNTSQITRVTVFLLHALGAPKRETCKTGTLLDIRHDVQARGLTFDCVENPPTLLHLLCSDNPAHEECRTVNNLASRQLLNVFDLITMTLLACLASYSRDIY